MTNTLGISLLFSPYLRTASPAQKQPSSAEKFPQSQAYCKVTDRKISCGDRAQQCNTVLLLSKNPG
ncbi:hypothetical protein [Nostoc sp. PA-18-2419]|uniref:hypothetical protein n=1 Tax=Nostoc sp. PA-18-2419 TaxID=2575443 RepID=UPI001CB9337E|nr:hypothetical protein [Nostoc sp. PA-18-2419]